MSSGFFSRYRSPRFRRPNTTDRQPTRREFPYRRPLHSFPAVLHISTSAAQDGVARLHAITFATTGRYLSSGQIMREVRRNVGVREGVECVSVVETRKGRMVRVYLIADDVVRVRVGDVRRLDVLFLEAEGESGGNGSNEESEVVASDMRETQRLEWREPS